jgi:type IV secretion system protein TrbJ
MNRISRLAAAGAVALSVSLAMPPSLAQVVVFDPNNYAQNVLTAARALQQINNQITSLQNQTQMLINQAKNLVNLPFSSLQQLQSSIQRTQQLLNQAQRIAYDVQQINNAFSTTYAPASTSASSQTLISNAQARWQTSVAALQDALRVQAGVVANLDTNRTQMSALVTSSQSATGALRPPKPATSCRPCWPSNSPISPRRSPRKGALRAWNLHSAHPRKTRAGSSFGAS